MTTTTETLAAYSFEEKPELEFFTNCLQAASEMKTSTVRVVGGSALAMYDTLAKLYRDELASIAPELDYSVFYPATYQSLNTIKVLNEWQADDMHRRTKVDRLVNERNMHLKDIAKDVVETEGRTPSFELDDTSFVPMGYHLFSCTLASFLMNYNAVTGGHLDTKTASNGINFGLGESELHIPDATFLDIFATQEFRDAFPDTEVHAINFVGFTIDDLSRLVANIRQIKPKAKLQAALSVASESSTAGSGTHHQLVPLEFGPERIVAHDPAKYGGPAREFSTNKLLRRWYEAQGYGYLVVHQGYQS